MHKVQQGAEEEQRLGFHQHMHRGAQVRHEQGGPVVVEEGRRHGQPEDVGVGLHRALTTRRIKPRKEPK